MTFKAKKTALVNGVGLNLNKFVVATPEEKQEVRGAFKLNDDDIFAISVAQLIKRKNHMVLIQAAEKLHNPLFHLFICGDGVQEAELKTKENELGIEHQIHF